MSEQSETATAQPDLPDAAADLLDADPEEFDSEEAYREWVDGRLAELQADLSEQDDRLDQQERVTDTLSAYVETVEEKAEEARQRAERAERMARWGGQGYDERLWQVVETLVRRAENGKMGDSRASITTGETKHENQAGDKYKRPGVYQLFDGGVSRRTCRRYMDDLSECFGFSVSEGSRGGWGGGSEQKALDLYLPVFRERYGEEWEVEDLLADMGGESGD